GERKKGPYAIGYDQRKRPGQLPGERQQSAPAEAPQEEAPPVTPMSMGMDLDEHHEWCVKMWRRMDRDESQELTAKELDCEEFHSILRGVLAPQAASGKSVGGTTYHRAEMNMNRAINFCMQKADFSSDGTLNFKEFKSFMLYMRNSRQKSTADMIFALFDLDGDEEIEEAEFREIYRFYLGHFPTEDEFQAEWARLDRRGEMKVRRKDYIHWLRTSPNKLFSMHAPPVEGGAPAERTPERAGSPQQRSMMSSSSRSLPDLARSRRAISGGNSWARRSPGPGLVPPWSERSLEDRPKWNQRFNVGVNMNTHKPKGQRAYFSRPQSLPELKRYYETHTGFDKHIERLNQPKKPARNPRDDFSFVF
ncbi:unnamed protein product, partial [Prorocentrum cordatum]